MQPQRRPAPTTLAFHASRIVIDIGVLLAMASLSLEFVSAPAGGRTALQADALPAVVLLLPIFVITLIPDHTRPLPRALGWASLILGLAAFPYAIVKHLDAAVTAETLEGSVAIGARLLVFGTFVTLVGIAIGLTRSFFGLPTGGNPTRREATRADRSAATGSRAPSREASPGDQIDGTDSSTDAPSVAPRRSPERGPSPSDESPFEGPLFDSLEIPAFVDSTSESGPSTLIFDAESASERVVDDQDDPDDR